MAIVAIFPPRSTFTASPLVMSVFNGCVFAASGLNCSFMTESYADLTFRQVWTKASDPPRSCSSCLHAGSRAELRAYENGLSSCLSPHFRKSWGWDSPGDGAIAARGAT